MSLVEAAKLSELSEGSALGVVVAGVDIALVRSGDTVYAISDWCSHAEVPLSDGDVTISATTCEIECYLHGSTFDLRTGEALCLPATEPVPVYPTTIEGDTVLVDLPEGATA